jgi:hypothetical protein
VSFLFLERFVVQPFAAGNSATQAVAGVSESNIKTGRLLIEPNPWEA